MSERQFATASELIRMALIYAIQDRDSYADADTGPDGDEAKQESAEFRAYLKKRFRRLTPGDQFEANFAQGVADGTARYVSVDELRHQADND